MADQTDTDGDACPINTKFESLRKIHLEIDTILLELLKSGDYRQILIAFIVNFDSETRLNSQRNRW